MITGIFAFLSGLMPLLLAALEAYENHAKRKNDIRTASFDHSLAELHAADERMRLQDSQQNHSGL